MRRKFVSPNLKDAPKKQQVGSVVLKTPTDTRLSLTANGTVTKAFPEGSYDFSFNLYDQNKRNLGTLESRVQANFIALILNIDGLTLEISGDPRYLYKFNHLGLIDQNIVDEFPDLEPFLNSSEYYIYDADFSYVKGDEHVRDWKLNLDTTSMLEDIIKGTNKVTGRLVLLLHNTNPVRSLESTFELLSS